MDDITLVPVLTVPQLGAALLQARRELGLSQAAAAQRAGVSRRWLVDMENGRTLGAEIGKILKLAAALGQRLALVPAPAPDPIEALLDMPDQGITA